MTVFANSRKITHKGSGQTEVAAPPDVCKTPSPGGPIPVPYVNSARDSQLAKGSKRTTIGGNPIALESSNIRTSSGDEPGTIGGLISSKVKGKLTWGTSSADVTIEGKGVVRFMDVTNHNGNSFNTAFMEDGGTGFAYADDFTGPCPICKKDPATHAVVERPEGSQATARKILDDLRACENAWVKADREVSDAIAKLSKDQRNSPNMKPETLAARVAAIEAMQVFRDGLDGHRRDASSGYMFGVMVCINGKKFAAVSGGETPPKFASIASGHGCTVIKDAAGLSDILAANGGSSDAAAAVKEVWKATMDLHTTKLKGYLNKPGTCAGAKLIGKSGHVADSMTEIFFAFQGGKSTLSFSAIFRGPAAFAPSTGPWSAPSLASLAEHSPSTVVELRSDIKRRSGETVPSCQSCQDTLYMAMCDKEKKSCG
nr:DUF4150 domain-containing protein [Nannocystis sp.]